MAQREPAAGHGFQLFDRGEKQRELRGGIFLLAGRVGNGEVGENPLGVQIRQLCYRGGLAQRGLVLHAKAETPHAGVELQVDPEPLAAAQRRGEGAALFGAFHGERDVVRRHVGRERRVHRAEDQNGHRLSGLTESKRLLRAGDGEIPAAALTQRRGDLGGAVAVGIRLYDAEQPAAVRQRALHFLHIVPQRAERNLRPCPCLSCIHKRMLLSA